MWLKNLFKREYNKRITVSMFIMILVCCFVSTYYGLRVLATCITANKDTQLVNNMPSNFEIVETISDEGILTKEGKLYPLDFVKEDVYPLRLNSETYFDAEEKCLLTGIELDYLIQNFVLQLLMTLSICLLSKIFIKRYWWLLITISLVGQILLWVGILSVMTAVII